MASPAGDPFDVDEEVRTELERLRVQIEHSKAERAKRLDDKRKELEKLRGEVTADETQGPADLPDAPDVPEATTPPQDTMSIASASDLASTVGGQTVSSSMAGQTVVRKTRKPILQNKRAPQSDAGDSCGSPMGSNASLASPQSISSPNPAELKRQREREIQQKKELQEQEEQARLDAQKQDTAKEKGGDLVYYSKGKLKGWGKTQAFAVVRSTGIFFYKTPPKGRGSTKGGVKYDDAKHMHMVAFEEEVKNSRGSSKVHKATGSKDVSKDSHPKADGGKSGTQFGINYFDGKEYTWLLVECASPSECDDWCTFLAKFIKVR